MTQILETLKMKIWVGIEKAVGETFRMAMNTMDLWDTLVMINVEKLPGVSILTELGISWIVGICCVIFMAGISKNVRLLLSTLAVTTGILLVTQQQDKHVSFVFVVAIMACLKDILQCMETCVYFSFVSVTKRAGIFRIVATVLMHCVFVPMWTLRQLFTISVFSVFPALLVASRMPNQETYPDLNIHNIILTLAGYEEINTKTWRALDLVMFVVSVLCLETMRQTITWMCTTEKIDDHCDTTYVHELAHVLPIHEHPRPFLRTPSRGDFDGQESGHSTPCCDNDGSMPPTPHTGNAIVNNCYFYHEDNDDEEEIFSPLSPDSTIVVGNVNGTAMMQSAFWSPSPGIPAVDDIVSPWMVVIGNNNNNNNGLQLHGVSISPLSDTTSIGKKLQTRKWKIRSSGDGLEQQFELVTSALPVRSRSTSLVDQTVESMKSVVTPVYYEFEYVATECHRAMSESGIFTSSSSSSSSRMSPSVPTKKETKHGAITLGVKVVEPQEWDNYSGHTSIESRDTTNKDAITHSTVSKSFSDDEIGLHTEVVVSRVNANAWNNSVDMEMMA